MISPACKIRLLLEQALWFKRHGHRDAMRASIEAAYSADTAFRDAVSAEEGITMTTRLGGFDNAFHGHGLPGS